jgi:hypothetical protein
MTTTAPAEPITDPWDAIIEILLDAVFGPKPTADKEANTPAA